MLNKIRSFISISLFILIALELVFNYIIGIMLIESRMGVVVAFVASGIPPFPVLYNIFNHGLLTGLIVSLIIAVFSFIAVFTYPKD